MQRFDPSMRGSDGVGHSFLGLIILAVGALLAFSITSALGIELPDPRAIVDSIRSGEFGGDAAARKVAVDVKPTQAQAGAAEPAPHCGSGQELAFIGGFADLKQSIGAAMGEPIECEHVNPRNGDYLQQTTTGLAVYEHATGRLRFTDGWKHWELTPDGLITWEGESADRPSTAQAASRPAAAANPQPAARPAAPTATPGPADGSRVRVANTDGIGVALRSSPNMDARLPQAFREGAELRVLERSGSDWLRVRGPNGLEGWVPAQYVAPVNQ